MSENSLSFKETWSEFQDLINRHLPDALDHSADCPPILREAMSYSLSAGGKRLRPILVLLSCEACGGEKETAIPAACAIEMVHTYSLIHDDLPAMDDDELRRGMPTSHIKFGEANAILAGDALLTRAFEIMAEQIAVKSCAAECCVDLANAAGAVGMVGGQVADLESEHRQNSTLEELEAIHRRKTGRLICSALTMGARIAGADAVTLEKLERYGTCIGLAFQITDDLLDLTGDEEKMGKGVRKDAEHGKLTYPSLIGVEESRRRAKNLIDEACLSIAPLGSHGQRLEELAHFILERDH
ncbi:polyprenyl synthetase family protein [uncultured Gimesia sp.]|uniref:polyprenyl synthetase family protein n=1 Tax=uncultured Gimesia sp. TaxID=1678688 RepID=UPI0030D8E084|tara:strand:+ start:62376 stop:63272 length:897 start_codon:yes stop_codon:yes gene_type:complete